jgi:hypothetical protein
MPSIFTLFLVFSTLSIDERGPSRRYQVSDQETRTEGQPSLALVRDEGLEPASVNTEISRGRVVTRGFTYRNRPDVKVNAAKLLSKLVDSQDN